LPRWFLPAAVDVIERQEVGRWIAGMKEARRVAVFRDEVGSWRPAASQRARVPRLLASSPGRIALEVPAGGERLLATSIAWSRGWSARSEGRRLETLAVNGAFLGVRVPAAVQRVDLRFLPPGFVAGCAAFGVAVLGMAGLLLGFRATGRRGAVTGGDPGRRPAAASPPRPAP
jgi:hypothetical protein